MYANWISSYFWTALGFKSSNTLEAAFLSSKEALKALGKSGFLDDKKDDIFKLIDIYGLDALKALMETIFLINISKDETLKIIDKYGLGSVEILTWDQPCKDGFPLWYHLWRSPITQDERFQLKTAIDILDLNQFMPSDKGVIAEHMHSFYYHTGDLSTRKMALVAFGADHNDAFKDSSISHILFQKGYNVLEIGDRNIQGHFFLEKTTDIPALSAFISQHKIPLKKLDLIFVKAHGGPHGDTGHLITATKASHLCYSSGSKCMLESYDIDSGLWTETLIKTLEITHPVKFFLQSCHGWLGVDGIKAHLPNDSEIIAVGKNRLEGAERKIRNSNSASGEAFEKALSKARITPEELRGEDLALLYSLYAEQHGGGALYAKKGSDGGSNQVICEDAAERAKEICYDQETISSFIRWASRTPPDRKESDYLDALGHSQYGTGLLRSLACYMELEDLN